MLRPCTCRRGMYVARFLVLFYRAVLFSHCSADRSIAVDGWSGSPLAPEPGSPVSTRGDPLEADHQGAYPTFKPWPQTDVSYGSLIRFGALTTQLQRNLVWVLTVKIRAPLHGLSFNSVLRRVEHCKSMASSTPCSTDLSKAQVIGLSVRNFYPISYRASHPVLFRFIPYCKSDDNEAHIIPSSRRSQVSHRRSLSWYFWDWWRATLLET